MSFGNKEFLNSDRIYSGVKIEIILRSDWVTIIENDGEEIASVKYPPMVVYLERDLLLCFNYPEEENEFSRMKYRTLEGEIIESELIKEVYISKDNTVVVDTGEVIFYLVILSTKMNLELEEKGWYD